MGKKCCIFGCNSNYYGAESAPIFKFPKNNYIKDKWIRFVNRKCSKNSRSSAIFVNYFVKKQI